MNNTIKLFGYDGSSCTGYRGDCPIVGTESPISKIVIEVVTGDEIMIITRKDGTVNKVDPLGKIRRLDYFDYSYVIYDDEKNIDVTNEDWFVNRTGSYDVINNYPVTKDYILDYDLSDGTDSYIDSRVINMLPVKEDEEDEEDEDEQDENDATARKVMVNDVYEMLGMPINPKYDGWYWVFQESQMQGLFNEKGERV